MIKSTTNKLLLTNIILFIFGLLLNKFWTELGLTENENIYYFLLGLIIYGISVGGVFVGFIERKEKEGKPIIGLIGNSILTLLFLVIFFYISLTMKL